MSNEDDRKAEETAAPTEGEPVSALEDLAQAVLDGRVHLIPTVVHNVGQFEAHLAPVYDIYIDPKPEEDQ